MPPPVGAPPGKAARQACRHLSKPRRNPVEESRGHQISRISVCHGTYRSGVDLSRVARRPKLTCGGLRETIPRRTSVISQSPGTVWVRNSHNMHWFAWPRGSPQPCSRCPCCRVGPARARPARRPRRPASVLATPTWQPAARAAAPTVRRPTRLTRGPAAHRATAIMPRRPPRRPCPPARPIPPPTSCSFCRRPAPRCRGMLLSPRRSVHLRTTACWRPVPR